MNRTGSSVLAATIATAAVAAGLSSLVDEAKVDEAKVDKVKVDKVKVCTIADVVGPCDAVRALSSDPAAIACTAAGFASGVVELRGGAKDLRGKADDLVIVEGSTREVPCGGLLRAEAVEVTDNGRWHPDCLVGEVQGPVDHWVDVGVKAIESAAGPVVEIENHPTIERWLGRCCRTGCTCAGRCEADIPVHVAGYETWPAALCRAVPEWAGCP